MRMERSLDQHSGTLRMVPDIFPSLPQTKPGGKIQHKVGITQGWEDAMSPQAAGLSHHLALLGLSGGKGHIGSVPCGEEPAGKENNPFAALVFVVQRTHAGACYCTTERMILVFNL